jgi:hypothetical protein
MLVLANGSLAIPKPKVPSFPENPSVKMEALLFDVLPGSVAEVGADSYRVW